MTKARGVDLKRLAVLLVCLVVLAACGGGDPLEGASSCSDLAEVDVASLSDDEAQEMGDLVFEFAGSALDSGDNLDFLACQRLVGPLDDRGVVLDLEEMDRE